MLLLAGSVVLIVASVALVAGLRAWVRAAAFRARVRLREQLCDPHGLTLEGDPFEHYTLLGTVAGLPLEFIQRGSRRPPGASDEEGTRTVSIVRFALPAPDMIACGVDDADKIMGPIPAAPRLKTGDADFDLRYRLFQGGARAEPSVMSGYRDATTDPIERWAGGELFARMRELDLQWFRVQDGKAELVLPPLAAEDVPRALDLAVGLSRGWMGASFERVTPGERRASDLPDPEGPSPWAALGVLVWTIWVGPVMAFIPALREMSGEEVCGVGARILVSSSSDGEGTSYGLYCSNNMEASLAAYYASVVALFVAIVFVGRALLAIRPALATRAALGRVGVP